MEFTFKKIITPFILASFLLVVFFGFIAMSSGPDGRMQGGCPFSATGVSLCPQDALAVALHHLSSYQSFISVPLHSALLALISALFLVIYVVLLFSFHPFLYRPPAFISYSAPPFTSQDRKIKRWLSLFEHSPPRW